VLGGTLALAQTADRLEEELRRTDQIIDDASVVIRDGDSLRSRQILDFAQRMQRDAWDNFHGTRLLAARRLTFEARTTAARAVALAREDDSVRERAQREMERADQTIARARDRVDEHPTPEAPRLLDQATTLLARARATFGEQHFLASMRLALASQRLAAQVASLGAPGNARGLSRDLDRTDHLLERVQDLVNDRATLLPQLLGKLARCRTPRGPRSAKVAHERRTREREKLAASPTGCECNSAASKSRPRRRRRWRRPKP
jgi:hypothetical protein